MQLLVIRQLFDLTGSSRTLKMTRIEDPGLPSLDTLSDEII